MATAKKSVKKATVKRAPAKSTAKTSVTHKVRKTDAPVQSFRIARPADPFLTLRVTRQTIYWAALAIIVLALGLWVVDINDRVQRIYDEVDSLNQDGISIMSPTVQ